MLSLMTTTQDTADRLTAAISYWVNCANKGTTAQRRMVRVEIAKLKARLAAL